MKLAIGRLELDLRNFFTTAIAFGLSMYPQQGLKGAIASGLIFGVTMMFVFALARMKRPADEIESADFVIEMPRSFFYLYCFSGWLCFFIALVSIVTGTPIAAAMLLPLFLLFIYGYFSEARQIQITRSEIIVRKGLNKIDFEKRYGIADIQGASVKWWGGLVVTFRNNDKVTLYPYCARLYTLTQSKGEKANEMINALLRLKDELMRRKQSSLDLGRGQLAHYKPIGLKPIFTTGVVMALMFFVGLSAHKRQALAKISKPNQQLRLHDFEEPFFIHKGIAYSGLIEMYRNNCASLKDFNCRLYSYFLSMEGREEEALHFAKMACSKDDPQSCFVVFTNTKAKDSDRKPASELLNSVCELPEYKTQTCCACYKQTAGL